MTDFTTQTVQFNISESYPFKEKASKNPAVIKVLEELNGSIDDVLQPFFFEFNDNLTRGKLKGALESYFNRLPIDDFRVVCDNTNNTPESIDDNRMNIDIWIQPRDYHELISLTCIMSNTGIDFSDLA